MLQGQLRYYPYLQGADRHWLVRDNPAHKARPVLSMAQLSQVPLLYSTLHGLPFINEVRPWRLGYLRQMHARYLKGSASHQQPRLFNQPVGV